MEDFPPQLP